MKATVFVEFKGNKTDVKQLENAFKELWKGKGGTIKELKDVELYYKPEENACYYFIPQNGETGKIEL